MIKKTKKPPPYPTSRRRMSEIAERLEELRDRGLHRRLRLVEGPQGPRVLLDGRSVLLLCSNDYLGLADHPAVRDAAAEAAMRWGAGAGASRLISGNMTPHRELEQRLAAFKGYEAALLFGSGYLANTGTIAALAGAGTVVFSDELNHASIIDGCRLARAETFVYRHARPRAPRLGPARGRRPRLADRHRRGLLDGRRRRAARRASPSSPAATSCRLMVDEAHATGALGPGGRGSVAAAGLSDEVDVVVGTLGKALGSYGAYACAAEPSWSSTCSTAPAPSSSRPRRRRRPSPRRSPRSSCSTRSRGGSSGCASNAATLRGGLAAEGLAVGGGETQIVPVAVGDAGPTMELCERSLERGVFAQGIRPPTVPEGSSRLRFTVMATHSEDELRHAAGVVGAAPASSAIAEPRRAAGRARGLGGSRGGRLRHRDRDRGRQDRGRRRDRPDSLADEGKSVAVFKPAVTGLDDPGEPDHELLRRAAGSEQSDEEIAPYRYGPPASPHLAAELAGERIDSEALLRRGRAPPPRAPTPLVCEGVGGLLVPLATELPGARLRRRPRPAGGDRRRPRPRHDQPHPADDRGGPRRRPRGRRRSCSPPGRDRRAAVEESNRETIADPRPERRSRTLPLLAR